MLGKLIRGLNCKLIAVPYHNYMNEMNNTIKELIKLGEYNIPNIGEYVKEKYSKLLVGIYTDKLMIFNNKYNKYEDMINQYIRDNIDNTISFLIFENQGIQCTQDAFTDILPHDLYQITQLDIYQYTNKDDKIYYMYIVSDCDAD